MSSLRTLLFRSLFVSACALFLSFSATSCASSGSAGKGEKVRVSLRDYRRNQLFELVGESHTNRVEYYSQPRDAASRKIVDDGIIQALAKELSKRGFKSNRKPGRAPSQGGSVLTWGIEIANGQGVEHWVVGNGTAAKEKVAFQKLHQMILELYNATTSYQTVENQSGRGFFDSNPATTPTGSRQ